MPSGKFQSTPGPKTGRSEDRQAHQGGQGSFNPLPARRPGEAIDYIGGLPMLPVSIHSRPEDREKPHRACIGLGKACVSIHSRPEDREKLFCLFNFRTPRFVSIHSRPEDREKRVGRSLAVRVATVSIHSRPEDREKRLDSIAKRRYS